MTKRMRRVDELIREVVSESIASLNNSEMGFVTVTAVRTSPDLRSAFVYISVFGGEGERVRALGVLERFRIPIQERINRELRIKRTPVLRFEYDQTVESSARLDKLFEEIELEIDEDSFD